MIQKAISLKELNTFGFEVNSLLFAELTNIEQLNSIWKTNLLEQSSPLILGGGSNILFTQDYPGLVLQNKLRGIDILKETGNEVWVKFAGGENWHDCVIWAVKNGFGGIENLSLIPGTIGAAPIQNIGAYGAELEQVFEQLDAFDRVTGKWVTLNHNECEFGYRDSIFKRQARGRYIIVSVTLKLSKKPELKLDYGDIGQVLEARGIKTPSIQNVSDAVIEIRRSKLPDPAEIGNCGSFFKNPVINQSDFTSIKSEHPDIRFFPSGHDIKLPAAWLIEKCGWKGYRRGDCGVHEKQALVLVNYGNATGSEVYSLALEIQESVKQHFGVALEMEVNVI